MRAVLRHGSEDQRARYLPPIATDELPLQAFGVTEPVAGTDTTNIRTFARRDGDTYPIVFLRVEARWSRPNPTRLHDHPETELEQGPG